MKHRVIAAFGAAGLLLSLGMTAASASTHAKPDNTGSCGTTCVELAFLSSGSQWVQSAPAGVAGTKVGLNFRTSTDAQEDWLPRDSGDVVPVYCTSIGTRAAGSPFTRNQCELLVGAGFASDPAWQLEYEPLGVPSFECASTYGNGHPKAGALVRLAPCGVNGSSVWIADEVHSVGPYVPYINGGSANFSDPFVVHEMVGAPMVQGLNMEQEAIDTAGIVDSNELVKTLPGL
jgi:hypothetical protein